MVQRNSESHCGRAKQHMNVAAAFEVGGIVHTGEQQQRNQQQRGNRHRMQPSTVSTTLMYGQRKPVSDEGGKQPGNRQPAQILKNRHDAAHRFSHLSVAAVAAIAVMVLANNATAMAAHSSAMRSR